MRDDPWMDVRSSTFSVLDDSGAVVGSAFRAPVLDASKDGAFLITAGHVLRPRVEEGDSVRVRGPDRVVRLTEVVVRSHGLEEPDVALLYCTVPVGTVLRCSERRGPCDVTVRGSPSGTRTEQANLEGRLLGREATGSGDDVLDIHLPQLAPVENPRDRQQLAGASKHSPAYIALQGLSGAPVTVLEDGRVSVIGHAVRHNDAGLAGRVYGVPIDLTARYLGEESVFLSFERDRPWSTASSLSDHLVGDLIEGSLETPDGEQRLWDVISGRFYAGVPMDQLLEDMVLRPTAYGLKEDPVLAVLEYFAGRFAIKRGEPERGLALFRGLIGRERLRGTSTMTRLEAVVDLRGSAERATVHPTGTYLGDYSGARDRLKRAVGDESPYYAYEVASCSGHLAMQVLTRLARYPDDAENRDAALREAMALATEHHELLDEHPALLREKQEVVRIAVDILASLATLGVGDESLNRLVQEGRNAALQRGNVIFCAQMAMVDALLLAEVRATESSIAMIATVGSVLYALGVGAKHEGVSNFASYLGRLDPQLLEALQVATRVAAGMAPPVERADLGMIADVVRDTTERLRVEAPEHVLRVPRR